ncbi:hypothetical protein MBANPS3_012684, partial [Mucor bainieri]
MMQRRATVRMVPRSPQVDKKAFEKDEVKVRTLPFGLQEKILELSLAQFQNRENLLFKAISRNIEASN